MPIIENFSLLSEEEQRQFANTIVEKLNANKTFIDDLPFKIDWVDASDISGVLYVGIAPEVLCVARGATWECDNKDDTNPSSSDIDYESYLITDVRAAFKTQSAVIDGYKISLDFIEWDEQEMVDYEIESLDEDEYGIGSYEYFGFKGYDSHTYYIAEGTVYNDCEIYFRLVIEAE